MTPPTGSFTCDITLRRVRAPQFTREDKDGVTSFTARDYHLAYETTLQFVDGARVLIRADVFGDVNRRLVVRDGAGRPAKMCGYVNGRVEIADDAGVLIFRGSYYDARVLQALAGDDACTPVGEAAVDHWESAMGEGPYAGHMLTLGGRMTRKGDEPLHGTVAGEIH